MLSRNFHHFNTFNGNVFQRIHSINTHLQFNHFSKMNNICKEDLDFKCLKINIDSVELYECKERKKTIQSENKL